MYDNIDIIIPVYNAESYLTRCIDSILQQTCKNWHLILIDDGSSDSSGRICDEYALKDGRITVIHKKNEGVSIARNTGLDHSNSTYITFIDSDDYVSPHYLANLIKPLALNPKIDISISGCYVDYGDKIKNRGLDKKTISVDDFSFKSIPAYSYYALYVVWGTMFKRTIIENNHLRFVPHLNRDEDFIFKLSYLNKSRSIEFISDIDYFHTDRENSLVKLNLDYIQTNLEYSKLLQAYLQISNQSSSYSNFVKGEILNRFERLVKTICIQHKGKERIYLLRTIDFDFFKKHKQSDNWKNKVLDFLLANKFFCLYCLIIDQIYKKEENA